MALAAGTRFGTYEITGELGAGGMGEVYRAADTTLEREVAIKVLPESFAADANRVARFEQEAKTLAALNHANIAHIYGLERSGGTAAIVMELVEGPTLADRIEQGPIAPDEALNIAMQIADALAVAHARGIVHRDLKPANVKLRPDGTIKVLDFGIAKAFDVQSALSGPQAPSLTTPAMTQAGILLGTAAYMSPEQARGKPVDQRTDIWAFGCVLYEMLTGQPAFGGEDVPMTLARVLAFDTDLNSVPGTISLAVRHTLAMCLEKRLEKRIADIRDVKLALEGAFETVPGATRAPAAVARPLWRRALPHAASLAIGAAVIGIAAAALWPRPAPRSLNRFDFEVPAGIGFRNTGRAIVAVSPDGRSFAYNTDRGLYIRTLDQLGARLIPGTEEALTNPFFAPDGQSVAYWASGGGQLKRIAISGGAPVVIAAGLDNPYGASWTADGAIYVGQDAGIVRVPANGGTPELVVPVEESERLYGPELLPDGRTLLVSAARAAGWDTAQIVAVSLASGERTVLVNGGSDAHYLPSGHLVYALGDGLFGIAFDAERLAVSGGPTPLVQGLTRAIGNLTAAANYGVAADGTLVYASGANVTAGFAELAWVDPAGNVTPTGLDPCMCIDVALSPDGTRAAVTVLSPETGGSDIWVWSFEAETFTRLTFDQGFQAIGVWTPDSRRIAYLSVGQGLVWRAADGTGAAEMLVDFGNAGNPYSLSAEDQLLFAEPADQASGGGIRALDVAGGGTPATVLATDRLETRPALSPDGRWLAYVSNETGQDEVYVRPYPAVEDGKWQVSAGGGDQPVWAPDGGALYYLGPTALMEARIQTEPAFRRQTPTTVVAVQSLEGYRGYAVAADGERFLMLQPAARADSGAQSHFVIVENWIEELQRLVPTE